MNPSIDLYYILAILNSKLTQFYLQSIAPLKQGGYYSYSSNTINAIPIIIAEEQKTLKNLAEQILELNSNLTIHKSEFIEYLSSKFDLAKITKKLQNWFLLDTKSFLSELKKSKIKLGMKGEMELLKLFKAEKAKAQKIKAVIDKTDKAIDQIVYELYGLTKEEIKIVEAND